MHLNQSKTIRMSVFKCCNFVLSAKSQQWPPGVTFQRSECIFPDKRCNALKKTCAVFKEADLNAARKQSGARGEKGIREQEAGWRNFRWLRPGKVVSWSWHCAAHLCTKALPKNVKIKTLFVRGILSFDSQVVPLLQRRWALRVRKQVRTQRC